MLFANRRYGAWVVIFVASKVIPASLTAGVIASEVNWSWGYLDCFR